MRTEPGGLERENLRRLIALAKAEDLGGGDVTGGLVPAEAGARGRFVCREEIVFCGGTFLGEIAAAYDEAIDTVVPVGDGERAVAGEVLAEWSGPARSILAAERVALNFLQRLSGVATTTRRYVEATAGTGAAIYDTRKTVPGWRALDKYAVRAGGGHNHRRGLYDAVLLKDNHRALMSSEPHATLPDRLAEELRAAADRLGPDGFVEIEAETLEEVSSALALPVDVILLDNMPADRLRAAVAIRDEAGLRGKVALEASGGVTLADVREIAQTGVERIAVGAVTHSAPAVDIALELTAGPRAARS